MTTAPTPSPIKAELARIEVFLNPLMVNEPVPTSSSPATKSKEPPPVAATGATGAIAPAAPSRVNVFAPKIDPEASPRLTRLLAANVNEVKLGAAVLDATPSNTGV